MYIEVKKWHQSNEVSHAGNKIHPDTIKLDRLQSCLDTFLKTLIGLLSTAIILMFGLGWVLFY